MNRTQRILTAGALLLAPAFGYIRLGYVDAGTFIPIRRTDNKGIQYYINTQIVSGAVSSATGASGKVVTDSSDPVTGIREAFAQWNRVTGADIRFLPLKSTDAKHDINDGKNTVVFASTADDLAALGYSSASPGAIAITTNVWYQQAGSTAGGVSVQKGDIADSDILLNPSSSANNFVFSTDGSTPYDIQTVLSHEIGHALGINHSGLLGSTMFQFSTVGTSALFSQKLISADERLFASSIYPAAGSATGTLTGKVTLSGGPVKFGLITMTDTTAGVMLSTLTSADGVYSLAVNPGAYIISAEPYGIVAPINLGVDSAQVTTGYQHTFAGGATPTSVAIGAGATVTTDFSVNTTGSSLNRLALLTAFGAAGGSRDISTANGINAPVILASGRAVDVAFLSGGVDTSTIIRVYGAGISVRAGSIHEDTSVKFSQGPLMRATLDITARETPALATLTLSKGTDTLALTGYFVIVPPKPVFTSKSVVSAASYIGLNGDGVVSPGGLYSIYAATGSALGPATFVQNGDYDAYGKLANNLGGVSVTFDGILAPMFLSFSGQLNVQVPFELAGKTSTLAQVNYNGSLSDKIAVSVAASQPAFFTITPAGPDSIAGNQDFKLNTATNPEARGNVVSIYGTGLGKLSYAVATGAGAGGPPTGFTGNNTCILGGTKNVPVAFTGWTPSAVGLAQWSFVIPADSPTGTVTVKCTDPNGVSTQQGMLYIK